MRGALLFMHVERGARFHFDLYLIKSLHNVHYQTLLAGKIAKGG